MSWKTVEGKYDELYFPNGTVVILDDTDPIAYFDVDDRDHANRICAILNACAGKDGHAVRVSACIRACKDISTKALQAGVVAYAMDAVDELPSEASTAIKMAQAALAKAQPEGA